MKRLKRWWWACPRRWTARVNLSLSTLGGIIPEIRMTPQDAVHAPALLSRGCAGRYDERG